MIIRPAVGQADIVPIRDLVELIEEPLCLELFSLEDDPRKKCFAGCGDALNEARPAAPLVPFEEGFSSLRRPEYKGLDP